MRVCAGVGLAVVLGLACGLTGRSQSSGSNGGQGQGQGQAGTRPSFSTQQGLNSMISDDADPVMTERRFLALNIERQKQIVSDTDKLLKLAKELNAEVAAQNSGTLTADEMHKIAEIEKLARNVRQRMTDGVGVPPALMPLQPPIMYPNH